MSNEASGPTDITGILTKYDALASDPVLLRAKLREVFANVEVAAPVEAPAAIDAMACYLEAIRPNFPTRLADVGNAITKFLVEWEKLAEAVPSAIDSEIPNKLLSLASDSVRRDKRFPLLIGRVEKALGRPPSKMTIVAVIHHVDPDAVPRMLKSEKREDVLKSLISSHGDLIDPRTATQVFKRLNVAGISSDVAIEFTNLKHRTIGALLPLDNRGVLGQKLSWGLLAAIIKPASATVVTNILRNSGSRRAIECCLDERVLTADADQGSVRKWLRAFFEGLARFADSDSEAMCSRLVMSLVSSGVIIDALVGSAGPAPWREHGRKAVINAALRAVTVPELRKRALLLLGRADDLGWMNRDATRRYEEALAIPQATAPAADDDSTLRWRICDRVIACLEKAADQNYDRVALQAILMATLGDFGLRTGVNAGDHSSFDADIHEITLWSCRQGEAVLLQTDVLRLDDPVQGEVVRKGKVIPVAKAGDKSTDLPTE